MAAREPNRYRLILSPPTWWRRFAALLMLGPLGLASLGLAAWMILCRPQAEPLVAAAVPWIFRRNRDPYSPEDYPQYVSLVVGMGIFWLALGVWTLWAVPRSERRLDERLSRQLEALEARNTRTLD